jgi:hypothetical protein
MVEHIVAGSCPSAEACCGVGIRPANVRDGPGRRCGIGADQFTFRVVEENIFRAITSLLIPITSRVRLPTFRINHFAFSSNQLTFLSGH